MGRAWHAMRRSEMKAWMKEVSVVLTAGYCGMAVEVTLSGLWQVGVKGCGDEKLCVPSYRG